MKQAIHPVSVAVTARLVIPGSKSITNRALLLAAMAKGESVLSGVLFSDDTEVCLRALTALGVGLAVDRNRAEVVVQGCAGRFPVTQAALYCGEAGTVTRFLLAMAASQHAEYEFVAAKRMMERPIGPLLSVLTEQGAVFTDPTGQPASRMPLVLHAVGLSGGEVSVNIRDSSQFLSGLLMAAPLARKALRLRSSDLSRKSYVKMTQRMMQDFGVAVRVEALDTLLVEPGQYQACHYAIEPDASTASYFWAMAALSGGQVTIPNLPRQGLQGDTQFLTVLERMGCQVDETATAITVRGPQQLRGVTVDMTGFSDTFMTVAALAVFADAPSCLSGLRHTRLQESDRVAAIAEGLQRLGIVTQATEDSLTIYPGTPVGAEVFAFNDHRIAMSLALIGLKVPGVVIDGAECVAKTCPDYFERMAKVVGAV